MPGGLWVESGGGLVEEEHRGTMEDGSRHHSSAGRGRRNGAVAGYPADGPGNLPLSAEIVSLARQLGPDRCRSAARCYELTWDAAESVRLMIEYLRRPDLLDEERVAPWRGTSVQDAAP